MSKSNSGKIKNTLSIVDPNEPTPLFITARAIGKAVVGLSPKTLANWRSYRRRVDWLWFTKNYDSDK